MFMKIKFNLSCYKKLMITLSIKLEGSNFIQSSLKTYPSLMHWILSNFLQFNLEEDFVHEKHSLMESSTSCNITCRRKKEKIVSSSTKTNEKRNREKKKKICLSHPHSLIKLYIYIYFTLLSMKKRFHH